MGGNAGAMVEGRKHAPEDLGRVLILGLGKSGQAVCDYCRPLIGTRIESITVAAGKQSRASAEYAKLPANAGIDFRFEWYDPEGDFDLCIVSPGIPQISAFYQNAVAASRELISEVEFAWRESREEAVWVAVTGTNGKTTTTALAAHVLERAGYAACAVGNIGDTCIEAVGRDKAKVFVAETSSYQLASTALFAPDVALLLNITPDHISWHGTMDAYRAAKLKVFSNLFRAQDAVAILDATDEEARSQVKKMKAVGEGERGFSYIPLGASSGIEADMRAVCGSENAAFVADGSLRIAYRGREFDAGRIDDLQVKGLHNVSNALCAAACAFVLGADEDSVREGLGTFAPLEHRIEPCGSVAGIFCYNDSKATNAEAVICALESFEDQPLWALFGGHDKGTDLTALVDCAQARCKGIVCYGEAGPRFERAFAESDIPVLVAASMAEALACALSHARAGDAVVLSPACASFDEFDSFEHRGRAFKEAVAHWATERGA